MQTQIDDALRADRAAAHSDKLIRVCAAYSLTLPKNAMEWRAPQAQTHGTLPSFNCEAELLCTDGIVAWFEIGGRPFFGHLAAFTANASAVRGFAKRKGKSKAEKLAELLEML